MQPKLTRVALDVCSEAPSQAVCGTFSDPQEPTRSDAESRQDRRAPTSVLPVCVDTALCLLCCRQAPRFSHESNHLGVGLRTSRSGMARSTVKGNRKLHTFWSAPLWVDRVKPRF